MPFSNFMKLLKVSLFLYSNNNHNHNNDNDNDNNPHQKNQLRGRTTVYNFEPYEMCDIKWKTTSPKMEDDLTQNEKR